jgi:hypothetical protein
VLTNDKGEKTKNKKVQVHAGASYEQVQAAIEAKNGAGKVVVEYDDADGDQYDMDDEGSWQDVMAQALARGSTLHVRVRVDK